MTKSELIKLMHNRKQTLSIEEIAKIVDLIFETMSNALSNNRRIEIRGFGCFSLRKLNARANARDPRNGKVIAVEDRYVVYYSQGKAFFDKINNI